MITNRLKTTIGALLICISSSVFANEQRMDIEVSTSRGSGEEVMIVIWAETETGDFIKTLHMFSKHKKYYNDMLAWRFKSRNKESEAEIDAVCGATIAWNKRKKISVPVSAGGINLLDGTHILRVESRKWEGNHYRSLKIPLPKTYEGGTYTDKGYVKMIKISLNTGE